MTEGDSIPGTIVFDTEPLVAYFCNEPGSDTVEAYLDAVMGSTDGYISAVNITELHYVVRAIESEARADAVIEILAETGIRRVDSAETWRAAADYKHRYTPALGDAFALATAEVVDGMLLVGGDDDYEEITDIRIERFREESG